MLQHAGNAETAVFAAFGRGAPALLESVVIGERQRLVDHRRELAAVDGRADGGLVGHRRRLDEVATAQLHRVDAGHARGLVDDALEDEVRLRPSGRAVGVVLVNTQRTPMSMRGMSYMPGRQRVRLTVWMLAPTAPI